MSKKEEFNKIFERGKKLIERLNQASLFDDQLLNKENNNLKSYDTLDNAELLDYSLKQDNSKLKDSISNTYLESSENGSKREGLVNSEGKYIKIDISQYKNLILKYGKIIFNNEYMNNSFINCNDILYLESKIPIFKASNSEIMYDTLKNYHQQGSDKEDRNNIVNINQTNNHKIDLDENNFSAIAGSKIFIFLHKIIQGNFRNKPSGKKKDISSAHSTEVIQNSDIIIGYSSLEMNKLFLSEDFKYFNKIKVVEKKKVVKNKKNEKSNDKNRRGMSKEKEMKEKKDLLYDEKGERIIGSLEITVSLKRPYQKLFKEDLSVNKIVNSMNNNQNININNNNLNNNNLNYNNLNNNYNNQNINRNNPSSMMEFIVNPPPEFNNKNNNQKYDDYLNDDFEEKKVDDGMKKIQTDINGDILILYLKINELKASNDTLGSQNSITNINNINDQLNNDLNKNIIIYNNNGPQPAKRNYFLRHKIFPDNKDANSEIVWNKVSPDFNYSIQMPFTLNQKTAELLDNSKFIVEIWLKGENHNECLGIVSFDLRNVLESLKVNEDTITTQQLYKNTFPYIIYDDYYPVTQIAEASDLGALYLKTCIGIGTPFQVNNFDNLIKKTQNSKYNQYNNMYNNSIKDKYIKKENNENKVENKNINEEKEKNNISLDPFKEDNKDINKEDINNNSRVADLNIDRMLEQNHKNINMENNNNVYISKESSIMNQKNIESFDEQPKKKNIINPFLVPQNFEQENKNSKKETGGFNYNNSINNDIYSKMNQNFNESNRYNQNNRSNIRLDKEEKNISNIEKKTVEYNINITHKNYNETYDKSNNNFNDYYNNRPNRNNNINDNYNNSNRNEFNTNNNLNDNFNDYNNTNTNRNVFSTNNNLNNKIFNEETNNLNNKNFNEETNFNKNNYNVSNILNNNFKEEIRKNKNNFIEDEVNNKTYSSKSLDKENNYNNNDNENLKEEDNFKDKDFDFSDKKNNNRNDYRLDIENKEEKEERIFDNHKNENKINIINDKSQIKKEIHLDEQHNNDIEIINDSNNNKDISHVKKHIFTISIDKIYNCQILSKLPPSYLRYQFFTDQKPLRSELFNYSQYSIDSSVIDVDMKSIHSIILPKVEKIKDYLNDFLVEFLYDNNNKLSKENQIIIGRVNIPSDEFASLISEKDSNKKIINEISRVLFIYGTEKIQRNKCIIGKLKLNFKYGCVDVPVNHNNLFNGSLSKSNNGLINSLNNNLSSNFAGSIYLEKETIFNRKIPKNACLKINVEKFNSSSLFEDYYRNNFSISFVFSAFGEVAKMENQYGKRATCKKHNLLNCEFNEVLSYKLEIDQDIIDYLKCRSGIVYLMYKISNDKKNYESEEENEKEKEEINNLNIIDFGNMGNNKRIIGKGFYNLNEILTSADTNYQEISIAQIGNGSMSLGTLNISLTLENDNSNINMINDKGEAIKQSPFDKFKKGLNNTTSDLYKNHNKAFNKCDPSLYLNGKFLFSIDFRKFYYEINSEIGSIINNSTNFYFVFKLGNKIKKLSPKFNKENNELYSLNLNCNLLLINYVEMIELDLNFNKKLPSDIYNLFNEGIFEIKLYHNENSNSLGSFYIDLHKLITSEFYSENLLYSGNNVINLINIRNNSYRNCKIELNVSLFKLNEMQLNTDVINKMNSLSENIINAKKNENNISNVDASISNLDYCEYYQYLFVKDFSDYLIQGIFSDAITINNKNNNNIEKEENLTEQNINETVNMNLFNLDKIKKLFNFNSVDMFTFINNNIINLIDNKGEVNIINFKKIFKLITKLNFDIFDYYYTNSLKGDNSDFDRNTFDYYLNSKIINLDNEDLNILNYLKDKQTKVDIGINNNSTLNDKNNKTIKKLLTTNYDYGFNETNDYFDVVSLCLFLFDYYYNLNDEILQNYLKIKNNIYSKTQPYIYKKQQQFFNHTVNNINIPNLNLNNVQKSIDKSNININNIIKNDTKKMVVSVLSGHNIIKPNSDFTSRPNCYFVLEFDENNYTSDVVMNSSHPNFNEELKIEINSEEYIPKLNELLIYITVFSFVDENGSIFIGRCEISPSKMFPFLNENNECEDFFHIIGEEGQVMGQLNIKFKFDPDVLNNITRKKIIGNDNSLLMSNFTNNQLNDKKNNNTISFSLNNAFENNNKKKFIMTGGLNENDPLHKKLEEAMKSIDDLYSDINNNLNNNINNNNNINRKLNMNENLSDIKSEEHANINPNDLLGQNNYENNIINDNVNENEEIYNNNGEEEENNNEMEMEEDNAKLENSQNEYKELNDNEGIINNNDNINNSNNNFDKNNLNFNNNINENEFENKMKMTDYNNYSYSQKLSVNNEENDKASFYSDTKENNKYNKMKYIKNYDKKLLNKIQKVMKNQK